MSTNAYYIFLALVGVTLFCIATGLSIRTWYWRRKIRDLQQKEIHAKLTTETH